MPVPDVQIDNLQRSLGRRIRELRSKHGWTQEQFAEYCGLHRTYMGHVERGEKNVSLSTVLRVATALGVRIPALFGGSRRPTAEGPQDLRPLNAGTGPASPSYRSDLSRVLDELGAQRKAMRLALRDLSRLLVRVGDST